MEVRRSTRRPPLHHDPSRHEPSRPGASCRSTQRWRQAKAPPRLPLPTPASALPELLWYSYGGVSSRRVQSSRRSVHSFLHLHLRHPSKAAEAVAGIASLPARCSAKCSASTRPSSGLLVSSLRFTGVFGPSKSNARKTQLQIAVAAGICGALR